MNYRLPYIILFATILLICACNKENNGPQEPELIWSIPYASDKRPELVYSDNSRIFSFANSPNGGLLAHQKSNGAIVWKVGAGQFQGTPLGEFFCKDVFVLHSYDIGNHFYGIDINTGQKIWEKYIPNSSPYSMKGRFGDSFFIYNYDDLVFQQINVKSGETLPLQAFLYPFPWESGSSIFGRINASGDTVLFQLCHSATHVPQYFLSAWNWSADSLWKEIPLNYYSSWSHPEKALFDRDGKSIYVRDVDVFTCLDAETLDIRWTRDGATGELLLLDGLLMHKKNTGFPVEVEVLDASTGAIQFSFETNSTKLFNKVDRLGTIVYHYNDPRYGWLGLEANAKLQAFQATGGGLRWDKLLNVAQGGEDRGVIYCDQAESAVFVFTASTLFRYNPVK